MHPEEPVNIDSGRVQHTVATSAGFGVPVAASAAASQPPSQCDCSLRNGSSERTQNAQQSVFVVGLRGALKLHHLVSVNVPPRKPQAPGACLIPQAPRPLFLHAHSFR